MPDHPLAEVFGFPIDNRSPTAARYRKLKLCPYNNRVPNCTKDKADNPLGVCSIYHEDDVVITCPIRFRQEWTIAEDAAAFLFSSGTTWTSLTEVPLHDKHGRLAGHIDIVLVAYDERGRIVTFGAVEVQAVYISGNVRRPFEYFLEDPTQRYSMRWRGQRGYPRPDYLSSSRKRLAPQLLYKGGILHEWGRKTVVVLDTGFYETLPALEEVDQSEADIAWLVYQLQHDASANRYVLSLHKAVYTRFESALD